MTYHCRADLLGTRSSRGGRVRHRRRIGVPFCVWESVVVSSYGHVFLVVHRRWFLVVALGDPRSVVGPRSFVRHCPGAAVPWIMELAWARVWKLVSAPPQLLSELGSTAAARQSLPADLGQSSATPILREYLRSVTGRERRERQGVGEQRVGR